MAYDHPALLLAARTWLERRPAATRADVARACGVSQATLTRVIREDTGLSYRAWRDAHRWALVRGLLSAAPPCSIKEVSAQLGFASPGGFWRWVSRRHGKSPAALRRALRRPP